ncbi:phage tail assembly protein [Alcaligenes sp. SDU_A2]|uniref:phage tail assembly protein n=1 Tax=Alcaligenes sp. SDU_A2 TaxID=3136634 RepID=UPI00311F2FCE
MSDAKFLTVKTLSASINAYGKEYTELRLREPAVADVRALKSLPYSFAPEDQVPRPLLDVCARYIARLGEVPESAVDQLGMRDFHELAWAVVGFFISQGSDPAAQSQA